MKFLKVTSILSSIALVLASGPTDGEAEADPNSAVVKLTTDSFNEFLINNPLVLAEFYAPWCGYCKKLAPEYVKAADSLNESHPNIKLAQIDCTVEEDLCRQFGIRGYPTLKVLRGPENSEDYEGPREAQGIEEYMIKQTLPSVSVPETVEEFLSLIEEQAKPFIIQISGKGDEESNSTFTSVADSLRKDFNFITAKSEDIINSLSTKYFDFDVSSYLDKVGYFVIHPKENSIIPFTAEVSKDALINFFKTEVVPYFGDINRDTYMMYMESPLPLGYYFYKTEEQREAVEETFNKLGKSLRGKMNFVGLDANLFGRHAESLNMDPEIVPLFAIQENASGKKYGVDQTENPDGPSIEQIEELVEQFIEGSAKPIVKSEPMPTDEEISSLPVYPLVSHNHDALLEDLSKDIFVEYYAHWCGHCKKLAPIWDTLGGLFKEHPESNVVVAKIDHSKNDVDTYAQIEGYPTLLFYPANGEIDEKTGLRIPVPYEGARELDSFIDFIKNKSSLNVDGSEFKQPEVEEDAEVEHDEL